MTRARPDLYVGNKNYSSWSMRPWLALKWGGIAFEEHVIPLGGEGYGRGEIQAVRAVSPSGLVPVLHVDGVAIYESLAICEWAAEQAPLLWPKEPLVRAHARSIACGMHAGWGAIRRALPMNLRRRLSSPPSLDEHVRQELAQLFVLWERLLHTSGGPFIFGTRTIVDAMFAPVATRLRTYAIDAPEPAGAYCAAIFRDDAFQEWERSALVEPWAIESTDVLYRSS